MLTTCVGFTSVSYVCKEIYGDYCSSIFTSCSLPNYAENLFFFISEYHTHSLTVTVLLYNVQNLQFLSCLFLDVTFNLEGKHTLGPQALYKHVY